MDRDFPVVGFVGLCAEILGLGGRRIHHLENMAQHGEPTYLPQLKELMEAGHESAALRAHLCQLIELDSGEAGASPTSGHFDAAASLQRLLEDEVFELLESIGVHENDKLILCGGVFNSWSLNDAVASRFPNTQFYVSFAPGNPGCAIGGPLSLFGVATGTAQPLVPFLARSMVAMK